MASQAINVTEMERLLKESSLQELIEFREFLHDQYRYLQDPQVVDK
jgi:hypothetical protein